MKIGLLIGVIFLTCSVTSGQVWNGNGAYSRFSVSIPDSALGSAEVLAAFIQNRYQGTDRQLQALYSWIATNIRYDTDSAYYLNRALDHETKIAAILRRRKGVCESYAALFVDLATRIGLRSYVIYGYPVGVNAGRVTGHAWCAAELDGEWWLFDPTWDAAHQGNFQYYKVPPSLFIQSHIPFDPLWQLLEQPVGYRHAVRDKKAVFHYKDSVQAYLQMDSLQQYLAIERRMKNAGASNEMFATWRTYNRMNIAIIAGEQDMVLYNSAVEKLNRATEVFNAFVNYRNHGFLPAKSDADLRVMLDPIGPLITEAEMNLSQMGLLVENFQYDTAGIRRKLNALAKRCEEQQLFLKRYLASGPTERRQMFYQ